MGAAASANLTADDEFELYDKLKKNYEENKGGGEKEVFEVMRKTVADYTRGDGSAPRAEAKDSGGDSAYSDAKLSGRGAPEDASTSASCLAPGDVVEAREEGTKLYFEAIIIARTENSKTHWDLQFSDGEVESCRADDIRKVKSFNSLEIGDTVKVREVDSRMEYEGNIVCMDPDGNYTVSYGSHSGDYKPGEDDADIESGIAMDRIRKIESHRTKAQQRWDKAKNVVLLAMTSFTVATKNK